MRGLMSLLIGMVVLSAWAQTQEVTDLLHGFKARVPEGWSLRTHLGIPIFASEHHWVVVGAIPFEKKFEEAEVQFLKSVRALQSGKPTFAKRSHAQGTVFVAESLGYPYGLYSVLAMGSGLERTDLPTPFRMVATLFKGNKVALFVAFFIPPNPKESRLKEMVEIAQSLAFLPAKDRVKWKATPLKDERLGGMPIFTIHLPEGWALTGQTMQPDVDYFYRFEIRSSSAFVRYDRISLLTEFIASGFGSNAVSLLRINDKSTQLPQAVIVQQPEQLVEVITALWQAETGSEWKVVEKKVTQLPAPSDDSIPIPNSATQRFLVSLTAEQGERRRIGKVSVLAVARTDTSGIANLASGSQHLYLDAYTSEYPKEKEQRVHSLITGMLSSIELNPNWQIRAMEISSRAAAQELRALRQMIQEGNEFTSQMARAWTNALSDQTYIRDPDTGEIFKVHKRVWDTGNFWQEPTFKRIFGTVAEGTPLADLLKEEGWKRMQESLSGWDK